MIDLHIHSIYSDGTSKVVDILRQAEELKLSVISITDHENCNAYKELADIDIEKYFSGKIIPGIELKTQHKDYVIDILGYGIDCSKMNRYLSECYGKSGREEIQVKQLKELYEYGEKYDLILSPMEELVWDKKRNWATIVFYNEMKSHEENKEKVPEDLWQDFINFKRNYYNKKGSMFYLDRAKYYPSMKYILDIIHKSGGLAFVAHIYKYSWMEDKIEELKHIVEEFDVDGVECYYSTFSVEEIEKLVEFCKKNNLLISGGTDYHGDNRPEIKIGVGKGNLQIPDSIIYNYIRKISFV